MKPNIKIFFIIMPINYNTIISEHLKIINESDKMAQKAYQELTQEKNMPRIEYLKSIYSSQIKVKQHSENNLIKCLEIIERIRQREKRIIQEFGVI
jgi:hypothetical protein